MSELWHIVWRGFANAGEMAYEVGWALVLGFAISGLVQAWAPKHTIERRLGGRGPRALTWATGFGAASSSCSYAAAAIAKSLFAKGASLTSALAFMFASTNLVFELGIVLWALIGWRFTLAEYVGGIVLVIALWALTRLFVSARAEHVAREHAIEATSGHVHPAASNGTSWHKRIASVAGWQDAARSMRSDISMMWREILAGFVISGFAAEIPNRVWTDVLLTHGNHVLRLAENVLVAPLIAVATFVCSVGNVPLAAVLWSGGISFAGVIAFLFADLLIVPIVAIYRRSYGGSAALRIVALLYVSMVLAALATDGLFTLAGLVPRHHVTHAMVVHAPHLGVDLVLTIAAAIVLLAVYAVPAPRGHDHAEHHCEHHAHR